MTTTALAVIADAKSSAPSSTRLVGLDFTKGTLVGLMILYHWLNYFVSINGFGYRYLRFLTPSFIFITGFFVSHIYLSKYNVLDSRLPKRLLARGLKLIAIFLILNIAVALLPGALTVQLDDWAVYLKGTATSGKAAFPILLPIGYLLVLSAVLVLALRVSKSIFRIVCLLALTFIFVSAIWGIKNAYCELVTIGLIGANVGYMSREGLSKIGQHLVWLLAAYAGYLVAITLWNELFVFQILGVCLTLSIIYVLASGVRRWQALHQTLVLLGQYSLFGYIGQIAILKALHKVLHYNATDPAIAIVALLLATVLTVACVRAVDRARTTTSLINRLYTAVFA